MEQCSTGDRSKSLKRPVVIGNLVEVKVAGVSSLLKKLKRTRREVKISGHIVKLCNTLERNFVLLSSQLIPCTKLDGNKYYLSKLEGILGVSSNEKATLVFYTNFTIADSSHDIRSTKNIVMLALDFF